MPSLMLLKSSGIRPEHGKSLKSYPSKRIPKTPKYKHKDWSKIKLDFINKYRVIFVGKRLTVFASNLQKAKQLAFNMTGKAQTQLKEITKI